MEIALHLLAKDDYILNEHAQVVLRQKICDTLSHRTKNFANAVGLNSSSETVSSRQWQTV